MQILQHQKKGPHLNTIERFYIHTEVTSNNQLSDNKIIRVYPISIFDTIRKIYQR